MAFICIVVYIQTIREDTMAGGYKGNQEHAFVKIERDMKSGNIPGLVLLCGKEEYLTDHYREALLARLIEPAARQLDLTEFSGENMVPAEIGEAAETLPLMSRNKVILLPGIINAQGRYPKHIDQSPKGVDELVEVLGKIPEQTVVIMTAERPRTTGDYKKQSDGKKLSKLTKTVKELGGEVYDFDTLERDQLRRFVTKRIKAAGKNCTGGVLNTITYDTGYGSRSSNYDLYLLENDLKKLIAYSGDKTTITEADAAEILTISPENNVFHMLDEIGRGRRDQALIDLNTLIEGGESDFSILSNIVRQVELMLIARELMDESVGRGEVMRYLQKEEKIPEYRAKKVIETASRLRSDRLKAMLAGALAVEDNIKSGVMSSRLALEYFITT